MTSPRETVFCQYHYDPLDRLTSHALPDIPERQRFYCQSRLATEIQGPMRYSIVQNGGQLLAQQRREGDALDTTLLATDQQRSVLHTLKADHPRQSIAYSPYGHRSIESGLLSLLGFNGERPDPVTGCYLLGNGYRAFNPVLMRFNSPDSLSPFGRGGLNPYAYCVGDPVNLNDPDGHGWFGKLFSRIGFRRTPRAVRSEALSFNKFNPGNYDLEKPGWSLKQATGHETAKQQVMAQAQKKFGALPGTKIERKLKGNSADAVKDWDNETGLKNMEFHYNRGLSPAARYAVINEGIAGNLNGVLPSRAKQFSAAILKGDYPQQPKLTIASLEGSLEQFNLDMWKNIEIYRNAGLELPDFLKSYHVRIPDKMMKTRRGR